MMNRFHLFFYKKRNYGDVKMSRKYDLEEMLEEDIQRSTQRAIGVFIKSYKTLITEEWIDKHKKEIKGDTWYHVFHSVSISEEFILKNIDIINLYAALKFAKLSEDTVLKLIKMEMGNDVNFGYVTSIIADNANIEHFSIEFYKALKPYIIGYRRSMISKNHKLTEDVMKLLVNELDWDIVFKKQSFSEDFFIDFILVNMEIIIQNTRRHTSRENLIKGLNKRNNPWFKKGSRSEELSLLLYLNNYKGTNEITAI
jgi:hypothetical protein